MVVNLLGNGFIGSNILNYGKFKYIVNDRNDFAIKNSDQVLYLVSTIDNYTMKENPYVDIDTNLNLLIKTLENLKNSNYEGIFNFASSWFVYGDTKLPACEESICNPKGFYSITKRTAEQILMFYSKTYNLRYRILRFSNVLGKNDYKTSSKKNVFSFLIDKIKNNEEIKLYNSGNFIREYIDVRDLVSALETIFLKGEVDDIYNIGNNTWYIFRNVVEYIISIQNTNSIIRNYPKDNFIDSVHVNNFYMNSYKLKKLGYEPRYKMIETIDHLLN